MSTYRLEGRILEACECKTLCPCWIGEDPDFGKCDSFVAYHIDRGEIRGVDVSGLTLVNVAEIPGNVFQGGWRVLMYLDDKASGEQREAIVDAWRGKLGGPLADLAALVGEVVDVRTAPVSFDVVSGKGTITVGSVLSAEMEPYTGPDGQPTSLHNSIFSTIPGSPAYVAKASHHRVNIPDAKMTWEFNGRNAIQGHFHLEA